MKPRVNYDDIAHLYDEPLRDHVVDPHLVAFLERRGSPAATVRVLDVGCGTGKQLAANRGGHPSLFMVGVDRFGGMLRIARNRCPDVACIQADGVALPFSTGAFDYATSQFSYPHVRNPAGLLAEIVRVLRSGGRFVMTNIDPWSMPEWLVYRYFPESFDLDRRDFVPVDEFVRLMKDAGFWNVEYTREDRSRSERLQDFMAYASSRHRASQLLAIPDDAYRAGLRRLQMAIAAGYGDDQAVRSEFSLVTVVGVKA